MAVVLLSVGGHQFAGTSNDVKPTDASVYAGATFFETDTRRFWKWDGATWQLADVQTGPNAQGEDSPRLDGIWAELRKIRAGLENYLEMEFPDPDG